MVNKLNYAFKKGIETRQTMPGKLARYYLLYSAD